MDHAPASSMRDTESSCTMTARSASDEACSVTPRPTSPGAGAAADAIADLPLESLAAKAPGDARGGAGGGDGGACVECAALS